MTMKFWAEIDSKQWDVGYPWCAGCEELIFNRGCNWQGNGCKYPEIRTKRPQTLWKAFCKLVEQKGKTLEGICDELGDCSGA